MRIDQYYDLDLHFIAFSAVMLALLLVYIVIRILIFILKFIYRRVKSCRKVAPVEENKKVKEE